MYKIDLGFAFTNGWKAFKRNFIPLAIAYIIATLLSMTVILFPIMWAGLFRMAIRSARGEYVEVGDVFIGFSDFGRYFVGGLLYIGLMLAGIFACCIGIFPAMGLVLFLFPLMVDKGYTAGQAYNVCWDYFKVEWIMLIVTAFILGMFAIPQQVVSQVIVAFIDVRDPMEAMFIGFGIGYGTSLIIGTILFPLMYTVYGSAYLSFIGESPNATPAGNQYAGPGQSGQPGQYPGQGGPQGYQPPQGGQYGSQPQNYQTPPPAPQKAVPKFCNHCGAPLTQTETVCPGCGQHQ